MPEWINRWCLLSFSGWCSCSVNSVLSEMCRFWSWMTEMALRMVMKWTFEADLEERRGLLASASDSMLVRDNEGRMGEEWGRCLNTCHSSQWSWRIQLKTREISTQIKTNIIFSFNILTNMNFLHIHPNVSSQEWPHTIRHHWSTARSHTFDGLMR